MTSDVSFGCVLASSVAVVALSGCLTVTEVRGPDGETAHLIKCPASEQCFEKATEMCPRGYILRSSDSTVSGYVAHGSGMVSTQREILVSCKADGSEEEVPAAVLVALDAERGCLAAYTVAAGFAEYWAARNPGTKRLEEGPERHDFVMACTSLPPNARRCMNDSFRAAHEKACDAVLLRLDPQSRTKIDALFLEAPEADTDDAASTRL